MGMRGWALALTCAGVAVGCVGAQVLLSHHRPDAAAIPAARVAYPIRAAAPATLPSIIDTNVPPDPITIACAISLVPPDEIVRRFDDLSGTHPFAFNHVELCTGVTSSYCLLSGMTGLEGSLTTPWTAKAEFGWNLHADVVSEKIVDEQRLLEGKLTLTQPGERKILTAPLQAKITTGPRNQHAHREIVSGEIEWGEPTTAAY
jgi:hypothetical protein